MYTDSQCALSFIHNPVLEDMRKQIDVIVNHARECEEARCIRFGWIYVTENVSEVSTKALSRQAFEKHRGSLS
jgi:hypothetical protein